MKTLTPTCSGLVWAEEEAEPAIPTPDSDVELGAVGSTLTSPEVLWPRPKGESLRSTPKATLQPIQTRYVKYIYAIISSVSLNKCKYFHKKRWITHKLRATESLGKNTYIRTLVSVHYTYITYFDFSFHTVWIMRRKKRSNLDYKSVQCGLEYL